MLRCGDIIAARKNLVKRLCARGLQQLLSTYYNAKANLSSPNPVGKLFCTGGLSKYYRGKTREMAL